MNDDFLKKERMYFASFFFNFIFGIVGHLHCCKDDLIVHTTTKQIHTLINF